MAARLRVAPRSRQDRWPAGPAEDTSPTLAGQCQPSTAAGRRATRHPAGRTRGTESTGEPRDLLLQAADGLAEVVGRLVELAERDRGLVGPLAQADDRLADLLGPLRLDPHPLVDLVEPAGQALDGGDDRAELVADRADLVDPPADLVAELVHLHHAGRDAVLHLLDHPLDVQRGHGGLVGQAADLAGDDQEARGRTRRPSRPRSPR